MGDNFIATSYGLEGPNQTAVKVKIASLNALDVGLRLQRRNWTFVASFKTSSMNRLGRTRGIQNLALYDPPTMNKPQ